MDWKALWKLGCSGKIKHFMWRLAHNSLAVRVNLVRRGMELDTKCVVCNRLDEDGCHLFFKCKHVIAICVALGLEEQRFCCSDKPNVKEVIKYILELKGRKQMETVTLLWHWWRERNSERRRKTANN
jgi:hypothetical protein